jgi:hypothetical protein
VRAAIPSDSRYSSFCRRAFLAVNGGLAIGYAIVLYRDIVTPDIVLASDFTVFWSAWRLILDGHALALYDEATQRATQHLLMGGGYFEGGLMAFLNPPHAALVTAPVGWLADRFGELAAFTVWTIGNLGVVALLIRALSAEWGTGSRRDRWMLAVAVLAFYPVFCALRQGQPSVLLALAVLGVYRAERASRPWAVAGWLAVISIKPQLVPMIVLYLAAKGCWRALAAATAIMTATVTVTSLALGTAIWSEYFRQVRYLEQFWGSGTPDYMLNVRGAVIRVVGLGEHAWIDPVVYAVWLMAMVLVGVLFLRRRIADAPDARPAYAFAVAVAVLTNPHVFVHDTIIWVVPLVLCAAAMRDAGADWLLFAQFALAWPAVFAAAGGSLSVKYGHRPWLDPHTWLFVAATVIIGSYWASVAERKIRLSEAASELPWRLTPYESRQGPSPSR